MKKFLFASAVAAILFSSAQASGGDDILVGFADQTLLVGSSPTRNECRLLWNLWNSREVKDARENSSGEDLPEWEILNHELRAKCPKLRFKWPSLEWPNPWAAR